jgi:predicted enzyme related to lactoylglutathione lyase
MDDGRVGHAELRVGDSVFMMAGEYPEENHLSPETLGGSAAAFQLYVPDANETYERAVANGATALRPLAENYGARQGTIRDPFGHRWFICTALQADDVPVENAPGRRFGDVGYVTFMVPDGERARRFYEALFGWTFVQGHEPGGYHISSITPPSGVMGGQEEADVRLYFRVDDIATAANRVQELGGQVLNITDYESGGNAECVDDQGLRFDLFRPRPGY